LAARALDRGSALWADAGPSLGGIDQSLDQPASDARSPSEAETSGRFVSVFADASGVLVTLEQLLVQLSAVEGRKALVLISQGFPQLGGLEREIQHVASLAREAATAVYFVDAAGLDGLMPENGGPLPPAFVVAWARSGGA